MNFGAGLSSSVVSGLYGGQSYPGGAGQAGAPAATSGPTGRPSLVAAAFGTDDGTGTSVAGPVAAMVGAAAWLALFYLYWVLPK